MGIIREIQKQQNEWEKKNFPNAVAYQNLLGVMEEVGELAHAHLKAEQNIRGAYSGSISKHYNILAQDAVGDIIIFLMGYCNKQEWDMEELVESAWREVRKRDWINNPETGEV